MTDVARPWWRTAVVYEVYPRSFQDGDGDGDGDLAGLRARLPYLADLGVDAVWIAPWYPSPRADGGYDITDHRSVDPRLGTLAEAEALIDDAHRLGLRVILDVVPNHTSDQHPWFREALAAPPDSPARAPYVFRDGRGDGGELPPNNWISAFGGPAWTRTVDADGRPGQWYLHTFAVQQPDLDWTCEEVRRELDDVLRHWLDRGVDGFRLDAVPAVGKVASLPDAVYGPEPGFATWAWTDCPHWDAPTVYPVLERWRRVVEEYTGDRVLVSESVTSSPERLTAYVAPGRLHTTFNFDHLRAPWDAAALRTVVDATLEWHGRVGAPATWVMGNHDHARPVTRLGRPDTGPDVKAGTSATDLVLGTRRARAAALLMLSLPGSAYVYQGEELGLPEVEDIPVELLQDPTWVQSAGTDRGRDGARVPLPWEGTVPPFGFSTSRSTWLPVPDRWASLTVERQLADPASMLRLYRDALDLRRRHLRDHDDLRWRTTDGPVLDFERGPVRVVCNLGDGPVPLPRGTVLVSSAPGPEAGVLPADAAVWLVDASA